VAIEEGWVAIRRGKMVFENRPAVEWHKGRAVAWLAERMPQSCEDRLRFYAGDDETHEDVFLAWPEDVTVRVGPPDEPIAARFVVDDPGEVAVVLACIAG
jgi:trehalose 6-phosphate phosphatase